MPPQIADDLTRLELAAYWLAWQLAQELGTPERPPPEGRPRYALAA